MTKKDLERENKFLKLQLKIIEQLLEESAGKDKNEQQEYIGACIYYSREYQKSYDFIRENDLPYNFYNSTMKVQQYVDYCN